MKKYFLAALAIIVTTGINAVVPTFKSVSVLSSGKWVKIKVGETGVYQLDYDQLREFGFEYPENVKVFGLGGVMPTENFTSSVTFTDDLAQVPTMREGNKIYFYARGVNEYKYECPDYSTFQTYESVVSNAYSNDSYYFLTDGVMEDVVEMEVVETTQSDVDAAAVTYTTGTAYWNYKKNLVNIARSGKNFMGEDFATSCRLRFNVPVKGMAEGGSIYARALTGLKVTATKMLTINVNDDIVGSTTFKNNSSSMYSAYLYQNCFVSGTKSYSGLALPENEQVEVSIGIDSGNITTALLDYVSVAYTAENALPADLSQARRRYKNDMASTALSVKDLTATTKIWLVNDATASKDCNYNYKVYTPLENGDGTGVIATKFKSTWADFVYFDTAKEQMKPEYVENVINQNLHGLAAPTMLIITTDALYEQAERIADFHRTHDNMDVTVLRQKNIFNEFSSGVPGAMAYRRICKMFYQRDPMKFRYLLLVGGGSYDNRQLTNPDSETELLITWQSDASNHAVDSYCSDDFFGVMSETASTIDSNTLLNLAIGRIPFVSEADCRSYIDKLLAYMAEPPKQSEMWRSNMLVIGEYGDDYIHTIQTEDFINKFNDSGMFAANFNKIYLEPYDNIDNLEGSREKLVEDFNVGQYFTMFIGHSNTSSMTKPMILMDLQKATNTKYDVAPIMYISSCDVGRYDMGVTSFLDRLLLNPNGGVICAIAATREAYTSHNGKMTNSFGKFLGMDENNGSYFLGEKTLGRVLMQAKNYSGDASKNRTKYHLFGDPAMKLYIPRNLARVTEVNSSTDIESVEVGTSTPINLAGKICLKNTENIDTEYNGTAKITLYDSDKYYMTQSVSGNNVNVYERGAELASVTCKVENGEWHTSIVIPEYLSGTTSIIPVMVTAISEDGDVTNGFYKGLTLNRQLSGDINDDKAPVIGEMYINDKATFADGMTISDADLRIRATVSDDLALNLSHEVLTTNLTLSIDGSQSIPVTGIVAEGQNHCTIDQPVFGLSTGYHTATLTASDINGNTSSRTLSFYIDNGITPQLTVEETMLFNVATIGVADSEGTETADIKITDGSGNVVFSATRVSLPYEWNVKDNNGEKVAGGVYDLNAIIDGVAAKTKKIVVAKQ